jgi:hypothetical protein
LSKNEVTVEQLLGMSSQQLADASLQEMRQKQYTAAVEDVQRISTEEELEAKRRSAMAGQAEAWRSGEESTVAATQSTVPKKPIKQEILRISSTDSTGSELEMLDSVGHPSTPSSGLAVDGNQGKNSQETINSSMDGSTSRSLQIEQRVLQGGKSSSSSSSSSSAVRSEASSSSSASRVPKRPLDADAMTRLTTSTNHKPQKLPRISESTDDMDMDYSNQEVESPGRIMKTNSLESPRTQQQQKAPSLLEIIKASYLSKSQDVNDQSPPQRLQQQSEPVPHPSARPLSYEPTIIPEAAKKEVPKVPKPIKPVSESKHQGPPSKSNDQVSNPIPMMRLLNKDGGDCITINRVKDINFRTTAMTNDK